MKFKQHPLYPKLLEWGKLISITGSAQMAVQALGLISGIFIIRLLSVEEYALYTMANAVSGMMLILADGGISTGVMAEGGKVWAENKQLGKVLATGFYIRKKFVILSLLITIPVLTFLLRDHGANWVNSIFIILSLTVLFFVSINDVLLEIPIKLKQQITFLQKNQVKVAIGRIALTLGLTYAIPFTSIALIANAIPRIYGNWLLRKEIKKEIPIPKNPDRAVQNKIWNIIKRVWPVAAYYAFSGQITIWLLSFLGSTASIAQIGALGRLAIVLTLITSMLNTLFVPRFARLRENKSVLTKYFIALFTILIIGMVLILLIVLFFKKQLLWVLGANYSNLQNELVWMFIASYINLMAGAFFSLSSSRGWVMNPIFSIVLSIVSGILGIFLFKVSTISGAIFYNIFLASIQLLVNFTYGVLNIKQCKS